MSTIKGIYKERIEKITIDDIINFDLKYTENNLKQKLTEVDKSNITECWYDQEDALDIFKKYIIQEIIEKNLDELMKETVDKNETS